MKRFLLGFILILSVLFTFMGCSEENVENEGTLDIQLATSGTKGVAPSVSLDPESYHIVVKNSSSVSVFDETVKIDADLEIALEPGLYNVAVDALNEDEKVIGRGTAEGTVEAGKSTVLSISILEVEGKGTLSINISAKKSNNIGYEVLSPEISLITSGTLSYRDGKHTAETELPNGFYVLRIKDNDTGKALKIESFRIVSDCTTTYNSAVSSLPSSATYKVGDIGPAGGFIFYDCDADNDTGNVDGLKSSECGWRYLEAAPADLRIVNGTPTVDSTLSGYSSGTYNIYYGYYRTSADGDYFFVNGTTAYDSSNCTGTAIGTGKKNTELHVEAMGDSAYKNSRLSNNNSEKISDYAARLCDILEYTKDGVKYDDWFLPSRDELNLMYTSLHEQGLGVFVDNWYWSSSEGYDDYYATYAWILSFNYGYQNSVSRSYSTNDIRVRPVRAFLTDEICEHTWNDGVITSEASCEHNGIRTYTCTECNMTKVEIIPMTNDHVYGDWITRTAATTSSDGEKYRTCSICGHEETDVIPKLSNTTYKVGELGPSGGYVFYDCDADNDTGNADGLISTTCGWRYLEAAPADLKIVNNNPTIDSTLSGYSSGTDSFNFGYYRTSASGSNLFVNGTTTYNSSNCTGTAIGTGKNNTELLTKDMGDAAYTSTSGESTTPNYAARLCDILEYTSDGVTYTDWFLPSEDELHLMYTNLHKQGLGAFAGDWYWSSSEGSYANYACEQDFDSGYLRIFTRDDDFRVRPVRAFLTDEICEHTWDDGVITSEASCYYNGIRTYTCTECNMTNVEIIPMTDHVYGEWITSIGATSTLEGEKYRNCKTCGGIKQTETIPRIEGVNYAVGNIGPTGGRIIYDKGTYSDGWRYLEAAPADLRIVNGTPTVDSTLSGYSSGTYRFYYGYYRTSADGDELFVNGKTSYNRSNCTGTAIGTGKKNTELLVKAMGNSAYKYRHTDSNNSEKISDYAARLCDILEYTSDGVTYTDWFLPSKDELNLMYTNLHEKGLGDFAGGTYWSSSEYYYYASHAWNQTFSNGTQFFNTDSQSDYYRHYSLRVRPVRAF